MSRHVGGGLAAASELFGTGNGEDVSKDVQPLASAAAPEPEPGGRRGSGRIRHEEKITVYVSAEELVALEQARLTLRARYGMAVDRGRIVREAIAAMLADLEASADDSELVRRLSTS
jgi:hypothetical protein